MSWLPMIVDCETEALLDKSTNWRDKVFGAPFSRASPYVSNQL
jgi:hypothetical protein